MVSLEEEYVKSIDEEYKYYSKLYFEKFGKRVFNAKTGGTKEKTIETIKKVLKLTRIC